MLVLDQQSIKKYDEIENDINFLSNYSQRGDKFADMAGFIRFNQEGKEILNFEVKTNKTKTKPNESNKKLIFISSK